MKSFTEYINESLSFLRKVNRAGIVKKYRPTSSKELKEIVKQEIETQGGNDVDLNMIDTSALTDLRYVFLHTKAKTLDLSYWDVSNVKDMSGLFQDCWSLTAIYGLEEWDVSKVTSMESMFYNCPKLEELDLNEWDVRNVTDMSYMFYNYNMRASRPSWYKE